MLRCGPLAQWAEQRTFNPLVVGSSPTRPTPAARARLRSSPPHAAAVISVGRPDAAVRTHASHAGCVGEAPIVVHRASGTGGRRVTARGRILGLAHSDDHLIEFLRRAGLPDAEELLDDPAWVEWQGGHEHDYAAN
jgi:hypothetical protein